MLRMYLNELLSESIVRIFYKELFFFFFCNLYGFAY